MSGRARGLRFAALALGLALAAVGVPSAVRRFEMTRPWLGVLWAQSSAGPVALEVVPGSPAWKAGLRPGDLAETLHGRPVRGALDLAAAPWDVGHEALRLGVRRGAQRLEIEVRPVRGLEGRSVYAYLVIVGAAFLCSGLFVVLRWPFLRGGRVYGAFAAAASALLVFSPTGRADGFDWVVSWLDLVAGALAPALLVHMALVMTRRTEGRRRALLGVVYVTAAALVAAAVWLVGLGEAHRLPDPVAAVEWRDRLQMLFLAVAVGVAAFMLARACTRSPSTLHRGQMRWMLWGLGLGFLPFTVLYALPWALEAEVPRWAELSVFPMLAVPAAFTVALARYRLHDLDWILRRALAEAGSLFATLATYALSQVLLREEGLGMLPLSNSGARWIGIVVAAFSYPQWRWGVRTLLDRAFYRRRYSYRATLLDWARELTAETELEQLVERLCQRVCWTLELPEARVYLRAGARQFAEPGRPDAPALELEPQQMEQLQRQPCIEVPSAIPGSERRGWWFGLRVKGSLRALLAVAEREGGESGLSSEDRALLATLAAHAASAIEAARLLHELREGARRLERLQARQERILESSRVGLLLLDGEGRVMAWNRALEDIYGLPREEALGRRVREVFPLHLVRALEAEMERAGAGREARLYRYGLVDRQGRRRIVNLAVSPAGQDDPGARVVSVDDVTEQVRLEEQLLQQERLAALGLLAAGVAHEVNTPLTGISSYAQILLEESPPDDPRREALQQIEAQTRRAAAIVRSLLDLARPQPEHRELLSLNDVVRDTLRLFAPQVRGAGAQLETTLAPGLPRVMGDRNKLQQVLLNLLLNARDAIRHGGRIEVATREQAGRVVLEVSDDGVGIAEEDLPRIFDPFFTTKGRGHGTGLGLSISYAIVREHEGEIEVDSRPGLRTCFRVSLPAAAVAAASGDA